MKQKRSFWASAAKWIIVPCLLILVLGGYQLFARQDKGFDFKLKNWDGKTVSLRSLKGKVVVLSFSYSFCSVRCPIITARLAALDARMKAPPEIVYLHISVDPGMDTPDRMLTYFNLYRIDAEKDPRWMFVSGSKDEIAPVWKYFGIEVKKVIEERIPEGYFIEYTQKTVVYGKSGSIEFETNVFFAEEEIVEKLRKMI